MSGDRPVRRARGARTRATAVLATLAWAALGIACRREAGCQTGDASTAPAVVAAVCADQFHRTRNPRDGLSALRALATLERAEEASRLGQALMGTPVEADALVIVSNLAVDLGASDARAQVATALERLRAGDHHKQAATVARLGGRLAWAGSEYESAIEAFGLSAQLAQRAGDATLETKAGRGTFTMLYELGDLRGAAAALAENARVRPGVDAETRALVDFDRGLLADAEGQSERARAAFSAVLRSPAVKGDIGVAWNASLNLVILALQRGDLPGAEIAFKEARSVYERGQLHKRTSSRIAWNYYSAQYDRLRGEPVRALEQLDALAIERPSPQWAWKLSLERGRALLDLGKENEGISALEKATMVIDGLRGDQIDDVKSWVLQQRRAPFVELFEAHLKRGDTASAWKIIERTQARTFVEAFASRTLPHETLAGGPQRAAWLKRMYPLLRKSPVVADGFAEIADIQRELADTAAVAYFEAGQQLHAVTVAGRRPRIFASTVALSDLRALVARFLEAPDNKELADRLGAALLPPGLDLGRGRLIYVAPSPALARVPFAALRRNGRYLVEDRVIAEIPSLTALVRLRARQSTVAPTSVVLANSALDLPEAEAEAVDVARALAGTRDAQVYLGKQANIQRLRAVQGARLLHLAVHSGVSATGPWLAMNERRVLAAEILEWGVSAELVVLASCASAATPDPGLWGSLVATFLATGSRGVVGSLWSTPDEVTRAMIRAFYGEGGGHDPSGALARAQRRWIRENKKVVDWAPFVFYGPGPNVRGGAVTASGNIRGPAR